MKRTKFLFAIVFAAITILMLASCGHYKDTVNADGTITPGPSVWSDGAWLLLVLAGALIVNGIRIFSKSSRGGSVDGQGATYQEGLPSLPWWKSGWGWTNVGLGVVGGIVAIAVQNWNK